MAHLLRCSKALRWRLAAALPPAAAGPEVVASGTCRRPCVCRCLASKAAPKYAATSEAPERPKQPPRFYATAPLPAVAGAPAVLEGEEAKHALKALRLKEGDLVELCDGRGRVALCEITGSDRNAAWLQAVEAAVEQPWLGPRWTLAVACTTLKGGRADWLVEKATELGAWALLPLLTERSALGGRNKFKVGRSGGAGSEEGEFQAGRLQRLAAAATKQCLRAHALQLLPAASVDDALLPLIKESRPRALLAFAGGPSIRSALDAAALTDGASANAVSPEASCRAAAGGTSAGSSAPAAANCAAGTATATTTAAGAGSSSNNGASGLLIVGPEGDFTEAEYEAMLSAGARPVGLGPNRLRTETAAIALLAAASLY